MSGVQVSGSSALKALDEAIQSLPAFTQGLLLAHYVRGKSLKSIAQAQGCSENAVKMRLSRARKKLKKKGIVTSLAALTGLLAKEAEAAAAAADVATSGFSASTASPAVQALADSVLKQMAWQGARKAAGIALGGLAVAGAVAVAALVANHRTADGLEAANAAPRPQPAAQGLRELGPRFGGVFFEEYAELYDTKGFAFEQLNRCPCRLKSDCLSICGKCPVGCAVIPVTTERQSPYIIVNACLTHGTARQGRRPSQRLKPVSTLHSDQGSMTGSGRKEGDGQMNMANWFLVVLVVCMGVSACLGGASVALAQDETNAEAVAAETFSIEAVLRDMKRNFQAGGLTMWFLLFLSILALAFILERAFRLRRSVIVPAGMAESAAALWEKGGYDDIEALCDRHRKATHERPGCRVGWGRKINAREETTVHPSIKEMTMKLVTKQAASKALTTVIVLCAGVLTSTISSAEEPPLPDYIRLDLDLNSEKPAQLHEYFQAFQAPLRLHLGYEPDKPIRQFWFSRHRVKINTEERTGELSEKARKRAVKLAEKAQMVNRRHLHPLAIQQRHRDASKLVSTADHVKGSVAFKWREGDIRSNRMRGWVSCTLELDVTLAEGRAQGTYTRRMTGKTFEREPSFPEYEESGTVTGAIHDATQMHENHRISAGKDVTGYPNNMGSTGFPPYDGSLVDSLDDARLVWVSEESTAFAWRTAWINHGGGYAPPLLCSNRIYQYYYRPRPGGTYDEGTKSKIFRFVKPIDMDPEIGLKTAKSWLTREGQEVVLCLDASTGATLWKRVMDFDGARNYTFDEVKAGPYQPPCIDDGKLFVQGTVGQLYCLDLLTGETLWEDGTAKHQISLFSLNCFDGMLVARGKRGLIGVDATSGEQRWRLKAASGNRARGGVIAPAPWRHEGKTYALLRSGLLDPKTGEMLWTFPEELNISSTQPMVHKDIAYLVSPRPGGGKRAGSLLKAYRLSTEGYEEMWVQQDDVKGPRYWFHPCVAGGRLFVGVGSAGASSLLSYDLLTGQCEAVHKIDGENLKGGMKPGYCTASFNGLISGNGSVFVGILPEAPYLKPLGTLGYPWQPCMFPICSDGRWFKRTDYGCIVCVDLRKRHEK